MENLSLQEDVIDIRGGSRGRVQGVRTPPGMTCGRFLINTVQSLHSHTKSALPFDMYSQQFTLCYFLAEKPSSSYSLLKISYVISQLMVHPLLRKILDPPLDISCTNYFNNRWNYTCVLKDGNRRVGSPTSRFAYTHAGRFAYMILRIVSVIRCSCITFNSVRRRIYMWGATWG